MRTPRRLIVNADGFGFGSGATQGILDALAEGGFVTSVSVNANFCQADRIREVADRYPDVSIGVHLNAMAGRPCLPCAAVPTLVGEDGYFHEGRFRYLLKTGRICVTELEAEFDAQILRVKKLVGDRISHLDSQENSHLDFLDLTLDLSRKWGIGGLRNNASLICLESVRPARSRLAAYLGKPHVWLGHQYRRYQMQKVRSAGIKMADGLVTVGYAGSGNKTNPDNWRNVLHNLPEGTYEIYCHPAYPDATLGRWASYCEERARELEILRQTQLADIARSTGVQLISFKEI